MAAILTLPFGAYEWGLVVVGSPLGLLLGFGTGSQLGVDLGYSYGLELGSTVGSSMDPNLCPKIVKPWRLLGGFALGRFVGTKILLPFLLAGSLVGRLQGITVRRGRYCLSRFCPGWSLGGLVRRT